RGLRRVRRRLGGEHRVNVSMSLCLEREPISHARVGHYVARSRGALGLYLRSQPGDVRAQGLDVLDVLRSPDLGEQLAVGHQPPAISRQRAQQLELDRGQMDLLALAPDDARGEVDPQAVGLDARLALAAPGPAKRGLQPGDELACAERL